MASSESKNTAWFDACSLTVEGLAWRSWTDPFARLPVNAKTDVPPLVWKMSRQPAGVAVRFATDAKKIFVDFTLDTIGKLMGSMNLGNAAGFDCYGRDSGGVWYWVGTVCPDSMRQLTKSAEMNGPPLDGVLREYRIYLPVCTAVKSLRIGVQGASRCKPAPADKRPPIVYYGTSIIQGVTASRPGMTMVSQLQRRLDYPIVNLGFSGCGAMDFSVVKYIAEIDARLLIVDCLPNMDGSTVHARVAKLVSTIRKAHPALPILFVGDRPFGQASFIPIFKQLHKDLDSALQTAVETQKKNNAPSIHLYVNANHFGDDFEGSADGSHPSDLGAMRFMESMFRVIKPLLK